MEYARIEAGVVVELVNLGTISLAEAFFPTIAQQFTAVPAAGTVEVGWTLAAGVFAAPPAPAAPTPPQQAAAMLAAGTLTVVSTGTPALDGIYAVDPPTQSEMQAVSLFSVVNSRFPGAGPGLGWPDVAGAIHNFGSVAAFQSFASGIADRIAEIKAVVTGQQTVVPSATVTIA